jgi:hypothetical protein
MSVKKLIDRRSMLSESFLPSEVVEGADAAANAEAGTITVPAGERWLVLSVSVSLAQGATQTPWPRLVVTQGNFVYQAQSGAAAQGASTTARHSWAPNGPTVGPTGATTVVSCQGNLPVGLILEAGATLATATVGLGANSDYGKLGALVVKLPV